MADTDKKKVTYLKSERYAGLTVMKQDGTSERFGIYFDTFKGDKVKVGFLATEDPEIVERALVVEGVSEINEKEFKETEKLEPAPVYSV